MSSYVDKDYFYYLRGRELLLYKMSGSRNADRVTQAGVLQAYDNELVYPDEDIENGLRLEYTRVNEPFISEALETTTAYASGTNISFTGNDIVTTTSNFWDTTSGFAIGDKITVKGSSNNDGDYTITVDGGAGSVSVATGTFTAEAVGERITITQIPVEDSSPSETSHPNVNQFLSLAVVDYVKAMKAESIGDLTTKEYYIREFYSKLGDNESNKRKMAISFPAGVYAVR